MAALAGEHRVEGRADPLVAEIERFEDRLELLLAAEGDVDQVGVEIVDGVGVGVGRMERALVDELADGVADRRERGDERVDVARAAGDVDELLVERAELRGGVGEQGVARRVRRGIDRGGDRARGARDAILEVEAEPGETVGDGVVDGDEGERAGLRTAEAVALQVGEDLLVDRPPVALRVRHG